MKKITKIFAGMAAFAVLAAGAALAGCSSNNTVGFEDKVTGASGAEGAYGFSAATAGMVISGMNGGSAAGAMAAASRAVSEVTDEQTIATLNEYMMLVESLLSDGNFEVSSGANDNEAYAQYELKMTVAYYDINGEKLQYETYYNQELTGSHTDYDDDDWDEQEVTDIYSIEGVMIIDGAPYAMEGRFVSETEGRESENTHTFTVLLDESGANRLTVTQESENEDDESENEYVYSLYSGGKLAERTTFEYESERRETEIAMSVYNAQTGMRSAFEFEKESERGKEIIKIKVADNGSAQEYIVRVETDENGNSHYVYYRGDDRVGRGDRFDFDD